MSYRKDFISVLTGDTAEKFPATEFMMFWPECLPEYTKKAGTEDIAAHFGISTPVPVPYNFCACPAFEKKVLEETATHIVVRNEEGITCKMEKGTSAMPHYIDFPIKGRKTFEEYKKRLDWKTPERVSDLTEFKKYVTENDVLTQLTIRGVFAFLRDFINFEDLMYLFVDEPELIDEMTSFHADFVIGLFGRVFEQFVPDIVYLGEDMAYKTASMVSPSMVEEFIYPNWKKIIDFVKGKGVKIVIFDSDGHTTDILPLVVKAGFTTILPLERAAGMDGEVVRQAFPQLGLIGGVDKLKLAKGKAEIDEEVEKAVRLYKSGRYIPSCDHSVPPIVSYENYKYYISKLKKRLNS